MSGQPQGCGAPAGGVAVSENSSGEAMLGADGGFRFFAAPGTWTVRVLAPRGARAEETVSADRGHTTTLAVSVTAPGN